MTPEEKAKELVERFEKSLGPNTGIVAAEICVNELLQDKWERHNIGRPTIFWEQVKEQLQKL